MTGHPELPAGLEYVRSTDVFDEHNHPSGLLRAHRIAKGVWGRLRVHTGELQFAFDDTADAGDSEVGDGTSTGTAARTIAAGDTVAIPPARPHHLVLDGPVTFNLEFYREPASGDARTGQESSGLPS